MPGGRWKPLQHWFEEHLFRDVISVCGIDGRCFMKNDDAVTLSGYVAATSTRRLISVTNGSVMNSWITTSSLPLGGGAIAWFCMDGTIPALACNDTSAVSSMP